VTDDDFFARYTAALRAYVAAGEEATLAVGHELGRQALAETISMLDIIEHHFRLIGELHAPEHDWAQPLQFLLQTLAALDVATRGFLDGTRRYAQERARAEDLKARDEFRTALVNSLQEGFFVADRDGAVVEINNAFTEITGYGTGGLPYRWPHPWVLNEQEAGERLGRLLREGAVEYELAIRHRDGRIVWVVASMNAIRSAGQDQGVFVGTIRDITAARAAAEREHAVMRLATAVSVAGSLAEVLSVTLEECRALDVARVVAVLWPPGEGDPALHVAGVPGHARSRDLDPALQQAFEQARTRLPLTVEPVDTRDGTGRARGMVAVLSADAALWLEHAEPRTVSAGDRLLVAALAGHLSLAIRHVRQFETARDTSLALQRAMLAPTAPPPGFAVRYEPADPPLEIGGDWYDVVPLGEHRVGVIVGDCVGRGLAAAAVMGQLRSSARALLLTGASPARVLEQLDAAAALIPDAYCTTVMVAVLDTALAVVHYSSAGHIPAVLAAPHTGVTVLADARSVPLAVQHDNPRPQVSHPLAAGATLVLFTDGLIERRGEAIDRGIGRVADILTRTLGAPVDAVADTVLRELAPADGYDDDVAFVVCRPPPAPLRIEAEATPDRLRPVRHRLAAWLCAEAVPDDTADNIVLAAGEACTNCVEHAYAGRDPGVMRLDADRDGDHIHVRVTDYGSWKTPPADPGHGGRGLPLIRLLSTCGDVEPTAAGTTVDMRFAVASAVVSNGAGGTSTA
jgi:PAS domain S-box-containing protein